MRIVWKFPLNIAETTVVANVCAAFPVLVGLDPSGDPCVWLELDTEPDKALALVETWTFVVVGTGHLIPDEFDCHAGSFVQGPFVWHVYYDVAPVAGQVTA